MSLTQIGINRQYLIDRLDEKRRTLRGSEKLPRGAEKPVWGAPIEKEAIQKMVGIYAKARLQLIKDNLGAIDGNGKQISRTGLEDTESCWFNKEAVLELLNQPGCVGIRIYYGIQNIVEGEIGYHNVVLVGLKDNDQRLEQTSDASFKKHFDQGGEAAYYYQDMLSDAGEQPDRVLVPSRLQASSKVAPQNQDNAVDFGGLGPPLPGPESTLN